MKVLVAGYVDFEDGVSVEEVVTSARAHIEGALSEPGCLAYSWTKDLLTPGRVWVYEAWETAEALDAHLKSHWYADMAAHLGAFPMKATSDIIKKYRIDLEEPVYDASGVPQGLFAGAGR
jgi:quinol monooxygenase YgiN